MHETFEVQLSKEEYVMGLEALFGELAKLDTTRSRMIFQRLATVVILLLVTGWLFPEALAGIFFIIVGVAVFEAVMGRFWLKSAHGTSYDPSIGPQKLEFTDAAIADSSAMRKREWSWDAVRRVHDRESALVFELAGWDMLVLPSRLWKTAEDRQQFLESIGSRITRPIAAPISSTPSPAPAKVDMFQLAAIGAFVDVCLVMMSILPIDPRGLGSLAGEVGRSAAVILVTLLSAALGYAAYRLTKTALPRLNARSPAAASSVSQALIWAFAVWFGARSIGWI